MGDLPLRTPTHRRLGRPLPYQLPNAPHAHPSPESPPLTPEGCPSGVLCCISRNFFRLSTCDGQVAYVLLTRAPVAGRRKQASSPAAPRLACVKPVASVHPEPGSNSPLLVILFFSFFKSKKARQACFIVCCLHKTTVCCFRVQSVPRPRINRYIVLGRKLTEPILYLVFVLLYYFVSIVIISMFSVPFRHHRFAAR